MVLRQSEGVITTEQGESYGTLTEVERGLEAVERRAAQVDPDVAPLGGLVVPDVVVVVEELVRVRG